MFSSVMIDYFGIMINRTIISVLLLLVSFAVCISIQTRTARAADCLSTQETRQAINSGKARHVADISAAVSRLARGDVIKVNLCRSGNGLVYQLVTLSRQGAVSRFVIDAKSGAILSRSGS